MMKSDLFQRWMQDKGYVLLPNGHYQKGTSCAVAVPVVQKRTVASTMEERLNKTERRFLNRLRRGEVSIAGPFDALGIQEITLRLGFDLRYTPDFHTSWCGMVTLWEVKGGFEREDAAVKIKMAAAKFPFFRFIKSVWKDGQWTDTVIRP